MDGLILKHGSPVYEGSLMRGLISRELNVKRR